MPEMSEILGMFDQWDEESQRKAAALLREKVQETWRPFFCPRPGCDGLPHDDWTWNHARAAQHPPEWALPWMYWLIMAGRGSGKTRPCSETVHKLATRDRPVRIALISPTLPDFRDIIIEGESGLLATAAPGKVPEYEPSKKRLTWPNGTQAFGYTAEEPDRLRGPQHHYAWLDEPAHMPLIEDVWSNLLFGLRLGKREGINPKVLLSTTPVPSKWMKEMVADPLTVITRGSTYDNLHNLADTFANTVLKRYENTRLGQQEIHGDIIGDVEGALWKTPMIELHRRAAPAFYSRIIVAVDPAGTATRKSDETGIIVIGMVGDHYYVIADWSGKYSPKGWADRVLDAYEHFSADEIVVEITYGRDLVVSNLETAEGWKTLRPRIEPVDSRRGKIIRADPVSSLYERGRVHHLLNADLVLLEEQLTEWVPGNDSPDRLDALVHGITRLGGAFQPAEFATPYNLLRKGQTKVIRSLRSVAS